MFEGILKNYENTKKNIEKDNETAKRNIKSLAEPITKDILVNLNSQVIVLHQNQQVIEKETKALRNECLKFYKEANNWKEMYEKLNESLKEIGDVVHFAKIVEEDLSKLVTKRKEMLAKS